MGVFIGLLPLIGLQTLLSSFAAYFLRANIPLVIASTFISNPFTVGTILLAQIKLGEILIPSAAVFDPAKHLDMTEYFVRYGKPLLAGSAVSAMVGGLVAYPIGLWIWKAAEKAKARRKKPG